MDFLHEVNASGGDLALGLIMTTAQDHDEIIVWDPKSRAMHATYKDEKFKPGANTLCTTNECGGVILCCSANKTQIAWWQFSKQQKLFSIATKEPISWLKILQKGTHILAGSSSGTVYIWNAQSGKLLAEVKAHYEAIQHIALSSDDSLVLTTCSGGAAKLWVISDMLISSLDKVDNTDDKLILSESEPIAEYKGHNNQITGAWINPFDTRVYTWSSDKTCKIWDMFSGTEIKTITCISSIRSMAVDKLESMIYLGCKNKNVYWFPIETSAGPNQVSKKSKRILNAHRNEICTLSLTKNEKYLVVGTIDGVLYIWDLEQEDKFVTLETHKDKGEISNIIAITKPLWMFGLNCKLQDTAKIPFLMVGDVNATLDKAMKGTSQDEQEFLLPKYELDLDSKFDSSKLFLNKSVKQQEDEYWNIIGNDKFFIEDDIE